MTAKSKREPARKAKRATAKTALRDYERKRDFSKTSEPSPSNKPFVPAKAGTQRKKPLDSRLRGNERVESGAAAAGQALGGQFVVQMHAARRLHYDLRLELDGVLKSWAVPNGPSLIADKKRLAVQTEDHPMQYLEFEGNIPKGEYGGGAMIVWDRGRWMPEGDPHFGLNKGHLAFALEGTRLNGRWHLVRMKPRPPANKKNEWLLIKVDDAFARREGERDITDEETTSHLSGRTTQELAAAGEVRADHAARASIAKARNKARTATIPDVSKVRGARKRLLPVFLEPSLAAVCERPPSGPKWVHEIKHDGYRIQARIDGGKIKLLTRTGLDWTDRFMAIKQALPALRLSSALIDGEVVVEDDNGKSSLGNLQADLSEARQDRMRYYAFDLLYCEGFDLREATLIDRKALLEQILVGAPANIRFSEHLAEHDGPTILEHTCRLGLEGIVSKRIDLPYRAGRGDHWLKSKCMLRQEFVIIGYIPSTAAPGSVGALLLGYYKDGKLHYAGRVGTGYSGSESRTLREALEKINASRPALVNALPAGAEKGVRWAKPQLVCEVEFRAWSRDRLILNSSFKGLREDEPATDVTLEMAPAAASEAEEAAGDLAGVRLTHPERMLWEEAGITKQGLAEFYSDIADWILPHVTGRPLSLLRSPSGVGEKGFFAKHPWHGLGEGIRRVDTGDGEPMLAIDDLTGLIGLVQSGVVEIHPWGSTIEHLDEPDRLIFDLDPGEDVAWEAVIEAAREVRERLKQMNLESFVKTSGGKGLHVVVPLAPNLDWDTAKAFTGSIAQAMSKDDPKRYLATMSKRARRGRVFVDYFRNGRGATAVAAYSTRARKEASVSTPLAWEELSGGVRADHFRVDNLRQRLRFLASDPWQGFFDLHQRVAAKHMKA
jgi:bifunctional non-homologous end joining protein LigD